MCLVDWSSTSMNPVKKGLKCESTDIETGLVAPFPNERIDEDHYSLGFLAESSDHEIEQERSTMASRLSVGLVPVLLILILGIGASAAFIGVGVKSAQGDRHLRLEKQASDLATAVETTWSDYKLAALWVHQSCHREGDHATSYESQTTSFRTCSRKDFRGLYEYFLAGGLHFQSIAFVPNVTDDLRSQLEAEAAQYYEENWPQVKYNGFIGLEPDSDPEARSGHSIQARSKQPFYFPQHLIEPIQGNSYLADFDLYSSARSDVIDKAVRTWKPSLSNPIPSPPPNVGNYVFMLHPGVKTSNSNEERSTGLSSVVVTFESLITRATSRETVPVSVYIYDTSPQPPPYEQVATLFGGARVLPTPDGEPNKLEFVDRELSDLRNSGGSSHLIETSIDVEDGQIWTVVVVADESTFDSELWDVYVGGSLILLACIILALWIQSSMWRQTKIRNIKNQAKAERAALILSNAKATAKGERELNEYLAHEVRNPLAASITACSFLSAAYQESKEEYAGYDNSGQLHHDIGVISSSLEFMYGLLRSVLDMSRAADNHLTIERTNTDILKDVLEPVKAMVYQDGAPFEIVVDCPENTVVMADRLRLKQIILNLTNNAKTFIERGYIRLEAKSISNDRLELSVADSGPGIPVSRRSQVFRKYQESLHQIQQGTGMGLSLCKKLTELMDGSIHLDETFQSGVEGCPGARFVVTLENAEIVSLPQPNSSSPINSDEVEHSDTSLSNVESNSSEAMRTGEEAVARTLPEELSVLVVDDDMIVRKLLRRSLGRVSGSFLKWSIQEAPNGETAISLAQSNKFDIIFLDQYMASHEKQLLGTEVAAELRRLGVTSRICGLSANDLEGEFLKAGADCFYLKPFPCEKEALTHHLLKVLYGQYS